MKSKEILDHNIPITESFRMRGTDVTRLETFMDAAFAFAMTMLVISLGSLPKNYIELIDSLKEIPAFATSFFIIMLFWHSHRTWSRRYGLENTSTIFLSISLIFILLIYIYPLRLIFSTFFAFISDGWFPTKFQHNGISDLIGLFAIYGIGLFAIAGILSLLYLQALKNKTLLNLTHFEINQTKVKISLLGIVAVTGLIASILALILPNFLGIQSGLIYLTLPISIAISNKFFAKRLKRLSN